MPSNTVVRFEIIRGTNSLGTMDVELFDQDKPQTVQNFLLYVQSGAYSNSFIHRLVPNFIVQGGGFTVTNPAASIRLADYRSVSNFGRLPNEFSTGPRLSNTFGTIAMAKVGGDPNSATSQWFFNLGNNSTNLDEQNGGFTVFGRVITDTNASNGTNLLGHFNTLSTNAGIVNLTTLLGGSYSTFSDLPVSYTNTTSRPPNYDELYHVRISVLNRTSSPVGTDGPAIAVEPLPEDARYTNGLVTVRGTASDDINVARVVYRLGTNGPLEIASGTTNWEAHIAPLPGFNTVTFQSIDNAGHFSTNAPAVTFFYAATVPLQLQIIGRGKVIGAEDGQELQVGSFYTLTAKRLAGRSFVGWSGSITSQNRSVTFEVPVGATNFTVVAQFANAFPQLAGIYRGLFRTTGTPSLSDAGFMTLYLRPSGEYRGQILYRGGTYQFTGLFDRTGSTAVQGNLGEGTRTFTMRLNLTNSAGVIGGTILGGNGIPELSLERIAPGLSGTNPPPAGRYTFALATTNTPSALLPAGAGFGTARLSRNGTLRLLGTLNDAASFQKSIRMSRAQRWPIYLPLDQGRGLLIGWLNVATNDARAIDGALQWLRPAGAEFEQYPGGITNQLTFVGSAYDPGQSPLIQFTNDTGSIQLSGGSLERGVTNAVMFDAGTLTVSGPNPTGIELFLDARTGEVNGRFNHPWAGTVNVLRGVVLQRDNTVRGLFVDGSETGDFRIISSPENAAPSE